MTEDDQMHWDYIVKCNSDVPAIQAADADMKAFRAKLDREKLADALQDEVYRLSLSSSWMNPKVASAHIAGAIIACLKEGASIPSADRALDGVQFRKRKG